MTATWRCVLVGGESLLIQCAQILEQQGHQVAAVVTSRAPIRKWAAEQGIRVLPNAAALLAAQDLRPFDYLFSVTNLSVLNADVLALPTRAAINFHDGPLPEYAGLNTPIWALLAGEPAHGITWHLMTAQVDQGDILVQRRFPLSEGETALTLNTKCYEAAIDGFEELVKGLADNSLVPQPQTAPIQKYFGRKDRPAAAGALRWNDSAAALATSVRALDFGTYANPVSSAKVALGGRLLRVAEAEVADSVPGAAPGTVTQADAQGITVATADAALRLTRLETLDGKAVPMAEAGSALGVCAGSVFDPIDDVLAERLGAINAAVCAHEGFWQRRLETQGSVELPYIDRSAAHAAAAYAHLDAAIAAPVTPGAASRSASLVSGFVGLLARLSDKDEFDLGFADPALKALTAGTDAWFAKQVPLRAAIEFSRSFSQLRAAIQAELEELHRRGTYANDLIGRVPELRTLAASQDPRVLPVAVLVVDRLDDAAALPGSELTVAFTTDGTNSRWIFDASKLARGHVAAMQDQFAQLMAAADADANRTLGELPLLNPALLHQVLRVWNDTAAPVNTDACVHRQIEEQAARTPDQVAITCEGRSLTYAELNGRANQLARRLAALHVGPDVLVGLMVERSVELMVGLLAIHKAGGAYVPLDPTYPRDRIAYMVEDSKVPVLLTLDRLRGRPAQAPRPGDLPRLRLGVHRQGIGRALRRWRRAAPSGLRDLHLGLDRQAQGRDGRASQCRQLLCRHGPPPGHRQPRHLAGGDQPELRHLGARAVLDAHPRLPCGDVVRRGSLGRHAARRPCIASARLQPVLLLQRRVRRRVGQVQAAARRRQVR